jgi:hypothetical protein
MIVLSAGWRKWSGSGLQRLLKKASPPSFGLAWGFSPMYKAHELRGL